MGRARLLAWTGIVLMPIVMVGSLAMLARDPAVRNIEWPAEMNITPAVESQGKSTMLPGGMTTLAPVPGTLSRNAQPLHYGPDSLEAIRAGLELANPLDPNEENLRRGRSTFASACAVCHGAGGKGDGPIIPKYPNPPSFLTDKSKAIPDGQLFHIITFGRNNMPAHGPLVGTNDRWRLVQYIRYLQGKRG
jgi:mono/diheme cytochrome c family protein